MNRRSHQAIVEYHRKRASIEHRAAVGAASENARRAHSVLALHHELAAYQQEDAHDPRAEIGAVIGEVLRGSCSTS